jgi:hypothetical protein
MGKILNVRERVHQPFRDSLIRTSGFQAVTLNIQQDLFLTTGGTEGQTNLKTGSLLPNDNSMIILAARNMLWFRNTISRNVDANGLVTANGDYGQTTAAVFGWPNAAGGLAVGCAPGRIEDVYRLYWQCAEGIFWTLGSGDKNALSSMPGMYFPYGGGLHGDMGAASDLIHWNNGMPSHTAILRMARAITIVPRQLIKVQASIQTYPIGANAATFGTTTAQGRDMLSPRDNLIAVDGIAKSISLTIDGLLSRDVQ